MQSLLTHKTVSLTELRDPAKVIAKAGNSPVAILNRNKVVGYFVPVQAVEPFFFEQATRDEVKDALEKGKEEMAPVLDYLVDK